MSNYLRKLGVFHTPPPLCALEDTILTGYVINTNGLTPTTLHGNDAFDKGRLRNKMNILWDVVMELKVDVLHITETHDIYMFVVSGHLYRPLSSSQPCGLKVKIKDGFGTHPPTFFGAGLSILVFF